MAAYLRCLNVGQREVGEEVGVTERTIRRWERDPDWGEALKVARVRWLASMDQESRARLYRELATKGKGSLGLALTFLERTDSSLRPAEVDGGGGAVNVQVMIGAQLGMFQGGHDAAAEVG